MSRYWAMRTDRNEIEFIFKELKQGKLRQGWGWRKDLNLNVIRATLAKGKKLNEDQKDVWRRQRRMHPEEDDGIKKEDYIILPNLPEIGRWSIAKVSGGYFYEMHTFTRKQRKQENYGHILEVEFLNPNSPINPNSEFVSAELRKTMTCRGRLWNIDTYKEDVEKLIIAIKTKKEITKPTTVDEKILKIYSELSKTLENEIKNKFHGSEFEAPVEKLLKRIYQNVEKHSGVEECGADFICEFTDGLNITHNVAIQVKMWEGEADLKRPLDQIKEAYDNYENISAGVIITTSESISEDFEKQRRKLEGQLNIPIRIIDKMELTKIFLKYLPEFIENE